MPVKKAKCARARKVGPDTRKANLEARSLLDVSFPEEELPEDTREEVQRLFANLKAALPRLRELLDETERTWREDAVYRFYHQSFKVYSLQSVTRSIVTALSALAPDRAPNATFSEIIVRGTGRKFAPEHNERWRGETGPILEAFFHARYFLEMAVRYGETLERAPVILPSGWAALLYLFELR